MGDLLEGGTRIPAFVSNLDKVFQKMKNMTNFPVFFKIIPRAGFRNYEEPLPHYRLASHHRARSGRGAGLIKLIIFVGTITCADDGLQRSNSGLIVVY